LAKSAYRNSFVLKGALLLLAYDLPVVRPSKDIDFLGEQTYNNIDQIRSAIRSVINIQLNDGVTFNANDIEARPITEDAEYGGLRIKIPATIGGGFYRLQLDIGFGDVIIGGPVDMDYPTILDFSPPHIKVYSIESSMAEKLEAIVSLGTFGSHLKDYFDVLFLINKHEMNKERLKKAIHTTFSKRNTPVEGFRYIFSDDFKRDKDKQQQWNAFLNRNSIGSKKSYRKVIDEIEDYIRPIL
jgi:predicted nucleotidyltransferase component of viral defense system